MVQQHAQRREPAQGIKRGETVRGGDGSHCAALPVTSADCNRGLSRCALGSIICDMILVLDTDVIVAGLRSSTGASAELLRLAIQRKFTPVVSVALVLEYEATATRPEHLAASGLPERDVLFVLDALVDVAKWTRMNFTYRPQTRDPGDDMVLEAALNSGANGIVTFNRKDYGKAPAEFNLGCWLPSEALEKLR